MNIFISHIHEEDKLAQELKKGLKQHFGELIDVFLAEEIPLGTNWFNEIKKSLNKTNIILVLFSYQSLKREWINIEAGYGIMNDKIVIPILSGGLKKKSLPIVYSLYQAVEISKVTDIQTLLKTIAEKTTAKKFLSGDIRIASEYLSKSLQAVQLSEVKYNDFYNEPPVIWLIGSHRVGNRHKEEKALNVANIIAQAIAEKQFHVVMGSSSILDYIACKTHEELLSKLDESNSFNKSVARASAVLNAETPSPSPVIVLGSLRSKQGARKIFYDAIGKIPDIVVLIGGAIGGRVEQELNNALEAGIPVLSLKFTGGIAESFESTTSEFSKTIEEKIQSSENRLENLKELLQEFLITEVNEIRKNEIK